MYSRDELKQSEMRARFGDEQIRYLIGDVRDRSRMTRAVEGADIVVHAAAMKQVPACEYNPFEAVRTNVLGAQHVVDAAIDARVHQVVALSTDKAVNPVNLYGATKLCAEKIFVQGNAYAAQRQTRIACVRYGNVVGSRGSVVPVFQEQLARDGRITITDERMTRFWITLPQAVDLVLHALENMEGGEIFIPKIPSMRVTDLAEAIAPGAPARRDRHPARREAARAADHLRRSAPRDRRRQRVPRDARAPVVGRDGTERGRQGVRRRLRVRERHERRVAVDRRPPLGARRRAADSPA